MPRSRRPARRRTSGRGRTGDVAAERLRRETGTLARDVRAHVCLAYPSPYRVGMSSLGFQTIYRTLNEAGLWTHRAFLPDEWDKHALAWPRPPADIRTYEGRRPPADHRVLAVSVAYELEIAGLVRLLEGARIPVLARDRGEHDPVVVIGGPLTFSNPYPLLPFADVLVLGEAEHLVGDLVDDLLRAATRSAALAAAEGRPHMLLGELGAPFRGDLPDVGKAPRTWLPARSAIVTPDTELADMYLVEPERGCSRPCTFCVMRRSTNGGMRWFDAEEVLATIPEHARRVGLVGAAVTDHPQLEALVSGIVDSGRRIGISSLRADRLTPRLLSLLHRGGYRQITVASDGISERMRTMLDRRIREEHLRTAAERVAAAGFAGLKVYEMIGAPGETEEDVDELIEFARELASIVRLTLTFSTFVPKRNTPLDGAPFVGVETSAARLRRIREALSGQVTLRPQSPKWAHVEYLLARAGSEGGHAAVAAVHAGGGYRAWLKAFERVAEVGRPIRYGDEEAWARRKGLAALRVPDRIVRRREAGSNGPP